MGLCNCCLPRPVQRSENDLLRGSNRENLRHRPYGQGDDRVVIDVGYLEDDLKNPVEDTWTQDIRTCWHQKASTLNIHTDLPRLVRKCTIIDEQGNNLTPPLISPPMVPMKEGQVVPAALGEDARMREDEIIVLNFLLALAKALGDDFTYNHISERFWDFFPYVQRFKTGSNDSTSSLCRLPLPLLTSGLLHRKLCWKQASGDECAVAHVVDRYRREDR